MDKEERNRKAQEWIKSFASPTENKKSDERMLLDAYDLIASFLNDEKID